MKDDLVNIVLNPARQRILEYLMVHKTGTPGEIAKSLTDLSRASVYRHINTLHEHGIIEVSEEKQVRGTVEKTYAISNSLSSGENDVPYAVQKTLMWLMASFAQYFKSPDAKPEKDMLSVSTSTLMMTDEEFLEFYKKIGAVISEYITLEYEKGRKERHITLISSPKTENN